MAKTITLDQIGQVLSPWIVGEYKWMPPNVTTMPAGWVKVTGLKEGDTIIYGNTAGRNDGEVKYINLYEYDIPSTTEFGNTSSDRQAIFSKSSNGAILSKHNDIGVRLYDLGNIKDVGVSSTTLGSSDTNIASGIYAVLWQYVGK